jgi:gluconate kinase
MAQAVGAKNAHFFDHLTILRGPNAIQNRRKTRRESLARKAGGQHAAALGLLGLQALDERGRAGHFLKKGLLEGQFKEIKRKLERFDDDALRIIDAQV